MLETKSYLPIIALATSVLTLVPVKEIHEGQVGGAFVKGQTRLPLAQDKKGIYPTPKNGVPELELAVRAVLVKDVDTGAIIYENNADRRLPIASLTKLMTAILASEKLPDGQVVKVEEEDVAVSMYRINQKPGSEFTVLDMLKAMLIGSANDAAMILARSASGSVGQFVADMNQRAAMLGMRSTHFVNPVGLDAPDHFSTASDLSLLVDEFLKHPKLVEIAGQKDAVISAVDTHKRYKLATTNKLLGTLPGVVGLKTGWTTESLGDLITLVDQGNAGKGMYYSIVLGSDQRELESEKLLQWVRDNFVWR